MRDFALIIFRCILDIAYYVPVIILWILDFYRYACVRLFVYMRSIVPRTSYLLHRRLNILKVNHLSWTSLILTSENHCHPYISIIYWISVTEIYQALNIISECVIIDPRVSLSLEPTLPTCTHFLVQFMTKNQYILRCDSVPCKVTKRPPVIACHLSYSMIPLPL